jgi:hypothetical protein
VMTMIVYLTQHGYDCYIYLVIRLNMKTFVFDKIYINDIWWEKLTVNQLVLFLRPSLYVALMSNFRSVKCNSNNR